MRYINKLETKVETLIEKLSLEEYRVYKAHTALIELECYLLSSKFNEDTTVQVKDVLARIQNVKENLY